MKTFSILPRFRRLIPGVAAALAAGLILGARLVAADAPADSAGTWYVFTPPKDGEVVAAGKRAKLLAIAKTFVDRDNPDLLAKLTTATNPFYLDLPSPPAAAVVGNQGNNQNTPANCRGRQTHGDDRSGQHPPDNFCRARSGAGWSIVPRAISE
jgi:hypothetical protein